MNTKISLFAVCCRIGAASAPLFAASSMLLAQATAPRSAPANESKAEETVEMSPFVTSTEKDKGYMSQQTMLGSRTNKNLMQIPAAVQIINREQIEDINAASVADVLRYGVSGVTENARNWDDFDIRGFRAGGSMRNGVVTAWTFGTNEPMYDVDRVEVIKGPAAMLLGNNTSIGGGVNLVPLAPTPNFEGFAQTTVSTQGYLRLVANSSGPLFKTDDVTALYRFTVGGLTGNPKKPTWKEDQKFVGGALALQFGKRTTVNINAYYFINDGYVYLDDFVDLSAAPVAKLNRYSTETFVPTLPGGREPPTWDRDDVQVDFTMLQRLTTNGNLRLFFAYRKLDSNRTLIRGLNVNPDNFTLTRQWLQLDDKFKDHNFQGDYQHHLKTQAFTLDSTLGADWASTTRRDFQSSRSLANLDTRNPNYSSDAVFFSQPYPTNGLPIGQIRNRDPRYYSYYFQENLSVWRDRVTLIGGLRWYNPGGFDRNHTRGVITMRPDKSYRVHKYGVIIAPAPWVSFYYTNSENIIPLVGVTDRFQLNDGQGPPLKDQQGQLEEFGLKINRNISEKLTVWGSLIYFEQALTNVRTSGPLPGNPSALGVIQTEKDSAEGWEFDFGTSMKTPGGRLDLILSYFNGKARTAADPRVPPSAFVPEKKNLIGKYTWETGVLKGFALGVSMLDQDEKIYSPTHHIDYPFILNAFARYTWRKQWDLQVNFDNITDKRYIVAVATDGLVEASDTFRPRLALKYRW